jgi:Na+/melibiose symporter-like transporter
MNPFRQFAFFTVARDSSFVALTAAMLMLASSFEPPLSFAMGATVALIFSVSLLLRVYLLTEERFLRSEAWRSLRPEEKPAGEHGRRIACAQFRELLLQFSKTASGVASILYAAALVLAAITPGGEL